MVARQLIVREVRRWRRRRLFVYAPGRLTLGYLDLASGRIGGPRRHRAAVERAVAAHLRSEPHVAVRASARGRPSTIEAPAPPRWRGQSTSCLSQAPRGGRNRVVFTILIVVGLLAVEQRLTPPRLASSDPGRLGWSSPQESEALALDVFERVNAERVARGAPPLVWDQELAAIAGAWSETMIRTGDFKHSPETFRQNRAYGTGENIASGQTTTGELHVGWMKSDGHRLNVLDADYDAIGIGIVCRQDGAMWATQVFGRSLVRRSIRPQVDRAPDPIVRSDAGLYCGGAAYPQP